MSHHWSVSKGQVSPAYDSLQQQVRNSFTVTCLVTCELCPALKLKMEDDALLETSPKFDSYRGRQRKGKQNLLILVLIVFVLFFVATTITLAAILGYRENDRNSESSSGNTCTSPTCIDAASFLRKAMDTSVNPCEDFYKYSCGNWEETNVIPEGFGVWSTFGQLGESNSVALKNALEQPVPEGDTGSVSKARYMYAKCMDLDLINGAKAEPLQALIETAGGWELVKIPELEPWTLSNLAVEHYWRSDAFFRFDIEADDFNSSIVVLKVMYLVLVCIAVCVYWCKVI